MIDINYICDSISNISAIPVRIYKNGKLINIYSIVNFPIDPMILYEKEILKHKENIFAFAAPYFYYYGIINYQNYQIILGPSSTSSDDSNALNLMYDLNIP